MPVYVLNPREPVREGVLTLNTTSRSTDFAKGLSPFIVGPVMANGHKCWNVENAWQYSKVYAEHVDIHNDPTEEYFEWRNKGYNEKWAQRYPMGKGRKALFSFWNGERLSYVEARKKIYIPLYRDAVKTTAAFARLTEEYKKRGEIVLIDFDAYNHRLLGMNWHDVINNPDKKMGHAFVLAMMLEGQYEQR